MSACVLISSNSFTQLNPPFCIMPVAALAAATITNVKTKYTPAPALDQITVLSARSANTTDTIFSDKETRYG